MYRTWTLNASTNRPFTCMTDFQSYRDCKKMIIGRWGYWPSFAIISKCQDAKSFIRVYGRSFGA